MGEERDGSVGGVRVEPLEEIEAERGIFCNRTLNMRSIRAIGYDLDYTLVHYNVEAWEGRAYYYIKQKLLQRGWPIENLQFDAEAVNRGLVIDRKEGNLVKANRFGYIKRAVHGTRPMEYREMRRTYSRVLVDLGDERWVFLNTLFSISEAGIYGQLVDKLDAGQVPEALRVGYWELYDVVRGALDNAHVEGELKADIMAEPELFVHLDEDMPQALLDQRLAGKRLVVITNSEWHYARFMLSYAFDRFLPGQMTWRELFHLVVVAARKPVFFLENSPAFRIVDEERGLLEPVFGPLQEGGIYWGGNASLVEASLGASGQEILYVGDHIFTDVNISKNIQKWRTALILRELEEEITAMAAHAEAQQAIAALMVHKVRLEDQYSQLRLARLRARGGVEDVYGLDLEGLNATMERLREQMIALDERIAPLVIEDGTAFNRAWGYLMRTGNDKSHLTRQLERYADIYTSRVSNFRRYTPFVYFRSPRGTLPHDPM